MKPATIKDIKEELLQLSPHKVLDLCLRLARYKKENKELLTYLLFESNDQHGYVEIVKKEIDDEFETLPKPTLYQTKKTLRKVLKSIGKYTKQVASRQAEAEMLLYFCTRLKSTGLHHKTNALTNLYYQQLKKATAAVETLHEDLHFEYKRQLTELA